MNCPACRRDNDARRRFCGGCGGALRWACPRCGFENDCSDAFCGGCGDAAGASTPHRALPGTQPLAVVPPPAPLPPPPVVADDVELRELLSASHKPSAPAAVSARVSQDELDQLFAGG